MCVAKAVTRAHWTPRSTCSTPTSSIRSASCSWQCSSRKSSASSSSRRTSHAPISPRCPRSSRSSTGGGPRRAADAAAERPAPDTHEVARCPEGGASRDTPIQGPAEEDSMLRSIPSFLRETAQRLPDKTAIVSRERAVTYAQLLDEALATAESPPRLCTQPGEHVSTSMEETREQ